MSTLLKILIAIAVVIAAVGGLMGIGLWIDAMRQVTPAFRWPTATAIRLPVVYSPAYNLGLFGIERLHPFDTRKYEGVFDRLQEARWLVGSNHHEAAPLPPDVFLRYYDTAFLQSLSDPKEAARISEIGALALLPRSIIERHLLRAFRFQTGGTAMATELAVAHGWAINLGGGFHHAGLTQAGGFCFFADLTLAVRLVRERHANIRKIMIIDLDAHQGDGHERDLGDDPEVFTVDLYGGDNYPWAHDLRPKIEVDRPLPALVRDTIYLKILDDALDEAFLRFRPDLVLYVAGSDVLAGDPLGRLELSADAVVLRDEKVFAKAFATGARLVMTFGGGYQKSNAPLIARSILNLEQKFDLARRAANPASQ